MASSCQPHEAATPLALYPGHQEGDTAKLQGTLEMAGGCLYISKGGERWLAAFPSPGTSWDPESQSIRLEEKVRRVGTSGGFAGGETRGGTSSIQWVQPPAKGCDGSKIWMVTALMD